jgi:exopolysaccharide biosynthesis polyprenyl glycosylphosphotransferase
MILDFLCVEVSFLIALGIRFGFQSLNLITQNDTTLTPYRNIMIAILCLHIALAFFTEPYSSILKRGMATESKKILTYNLYMFVGIVILLFTRKSSGTYSRTVVYILPIVNCVLMFVCRYCYKRYLRRRINKAENQDCMLLIAPYRQINGILHKFYKNEVSTLKIVGILPTDDVVEDSFDAGVSKEAAVTLEALGEESDDASEISLNIHADKKVWKIPGNVGSEARDIPVLKNLEEMYEYARINVVDEVMIFAEGEEAEKIANSLIDMGITVHISIRNLVQVPRATVNRVNGISVITTSANTVTERQLIIKRLIDIFFGFFGSIATILATLVVAPMIWISDPGPIFFRQERVGKNGRTFKIWKFRTMYKDAEARKAELMEKNKMSGLMFKMDDDPRIIGYGKRFSVGKFLRESSIDELPQSFNILAGSMSVVGTRPPTVKEYEQYELHHKGRLATKPGLTGMWQVSGRSDITDFEEVVRLDKEYIDNFSLSLDLEIILKTFKVVLGREGSV